MSTIAFITADTHLFVSNAVSMKSTEVLNLVGAVISIGIKTRRLVHTHKLTGYYIHCGDTFLICIIQLCLELLWQKPNLSLKRDTEKNSFN